jgi:serine/threonine-protein kinase
MQMAGSPSELRAIFWEALERAGPQEQAAYLDQACQGRPQLRARLEALLRAHAEASGFLQEPADNEPTRVGAAVAPPQQTRDLPPPVPLVPGYEIGTRLGQGGMGVVYRARHVQLNRVVALKMILAGNLAGADDVARFLSEAEAVAALQHPNIVQIFEIGRHDGMPFMALEYVAGDSLATRLQPGPLLPRQAARLVEQLARGMNVAHQAGIVHRDLKPANILLQEEVARRGAESAEEDFSALSAPLRATSLCPKITDFGLAKRVETAPDGAPLSAEGLTRTGLIMGTPSYMAPEQAQGQGKQVGPAADVYALGAILYECLTGRPPFKASTVLETLQQIVDEEPVPPRQLQPRLPKDLQTICLKCLSKEPQKRYARAFDLAEDLRRWQNLEPILARPVGRLERAVKWVRRRPAMAALGVALLLLLIAGLEAIRGAFSYQHLQIQQAGEQARQETERRARRNYLNQEVVTAVREAEQERHHLQERLNDPLKVHVFLSDLHKWQQALDRTRAAVTRAQKLADVTPELLEPELAARLETLQKQLAADAEAYRLADKLDAIRQEAYLWIESMHNFAAAGPKYAVAFREAGLAMDHGSAQELAEQVRRSPARYALVVALDFWAEVNDDPKLLQRLLAVTRLADPDPWRNQVRDPKRWQDRKALQQLATQAPAGGQSPHLLILLSDMLGQADGDPLPLLRQAVLAHPQDFWLSCALGGRCQEPAERIGYYQAALAIRPLSVAALNNLGLALYRSKDVVGAIACYQKALTIDSKHAFSHCGLGTALRAKQDVKGAIACFQKALECDPKLAIAHTGMGLALYDARGKGDVEEAIACYQKALECDPKLAIAHGNLGLALYAKKDVEGAIACYQKALKYDPRLAEAHCCLGNVLQAKQDLAGAIACYQKALECDPRFATAHNNLGTALEAKRDLTGAVACFRKAMELDPRYPQAHINLGNALRRLGQFAEALPELKMGHALGSKRFGWPSADWVKQCEQLLALDRKWAAIQKGEAQPADAAEQVALAGLCVVYKQRYAAAVEFYAAAFTAEPQLTEDPQRPTRYHAACAAALAAAGKGKDASKLDASARAKLRQQTLDWLRADLELWRFQLKSKESTQRQNVIKYLSIWQTEPNLAAVRDAPGLVQLPEAERQTWQQLWLEVAEVVQKAKQ